MPIKYRVKDYQPKSYYHIYNKGIEGRKIFEANEDYELFEKILSQYVSDQRPNEGPYKGLSPSRQKVKDQMSLKNEVQINAFVLMPDHFHLLVYQEMTDGIVKLMRRVNTGYVMAFNKKYGRRGTLFETNYRAVRVKGEEERLHLTRFIHLNPVNRIVKRFGPVETVTGSKPEDYSYSSYSHYIGVNTYNWITKIPSVFEAERYRRWTEDPRILSGKYLMNLTLDTIE